MTVDDINKRFTHYPPANDEDVSYHSQVRHAIWGAAECLRLLCPEGRELSLAITKLEEATFWANAALARSRAQIFTEKR